MTYPAVESAIDAAYWFIDKSIEDKYFVDDKKLQQLLFLAQLWYAQAYNHNMLIPSVFICDENGFYEPNLQKILKQGRPFLPQAKIIPAVDDFLNEIWNKYAKCSELELQNIIKNTVIYRNTYKNNDKSLLDFKSIVEYLNRNSTIVGSDGGKENKKILLSQNGPVIVSKWHPRKVSANNSKQGAKYV